MIISPKATTAFFWKPHLSFLLCKNLGKYVAEYVTEEELNQ